MKEKSDAEIFLEYVPAYNIWYKILLLYLYHFLIFILALTFFWWTSSNYYILALPTQLFLSLGANIPFIYMFTNIKKIRKKYGEKRDKSSWLHFFYHYSYTSPLGCAALYSPLILITYNYPNFQIINLPSNIFTRNLLPIYVTIPVSVILFIFGILLAKASQGYDGDMHSYLYVMCPKKISIFRKGIYNYIRHPRFLCRFFTAFGIGIIANNLLAILVVLIHFLPYYWWMKTLDYELVRNFGLEIKAYQEKVNSLFPKFGTWKKVLNILFAS